MMPKLFGIGFAILLVFLSLSEPAEAHLLDEYLQATILSIEQDTVLAHLRLTPGVDVASLVISSIDSDSNGIISASEASAYAQRVRDDLTLTVDGNPKDLRLLSVHVPSVEDMKTGLAEIQMDFRADLPRRGGGGVGNRTLTIENRHLRGISFYLMNAEVPGDANIRIVSQDRDANQTFYRLNYIQAESGATLPSLTWWQDVRWWLGAALLLAGSAFWWQRKQVALTISNHKPQSSDSHDRPN